MSSHNNDPVLVVDDLRVAFPNRDGGFTEAVRGVSFTLGRERLGIVGESGSGKSTLARCLIRLIDPTAGEIHWADHEIATLSESQLRPLRSHVQVVFQDPNRSLNPRRTVGQSIVEGAINFGMSEDKARQLSETLMQQVRLPVESLSRYPTQFSGGQRQRLAIARALLKDPPVLILDEATSALDAATEARVQKALAALMAGRTTFIIAHRLSTVRDADEILVFAGGEIAERGGFKELVAQGGHFAELVRTQLTGPASP